MAKPIAGYGSKSNFGSRPLSLALAASENTGKLKSGTDVAEYEGLIPTLGGITRYASEFFWSQLDAIRGHFYPTGTNQQPIGRAELEKLESWTLFWFGSA